MGELSMASSSNKFINTKNRACLCLLIGLISCYPQQNILQFSGYSGILNYLDSSKIELQSIEIGESLRYLKKEQSESFLRMEELFQRNYYQQDFSMWIGYDFFGEWISFVRFIPPEAASLGQTGLKATIFEVYNLSLLSYIQADNTVTIRLYDTAGILWHLFSGF